MAASATEFLARGLEANQATELAAQINGAPETPSAKRLIGAGFSVPLANELARQMVAGTGNTSKLMGLGVHPLLASKIAAEITEAGA